MSQVTDNAGRPEPPLTRTTRVVSTRGISPRIAPRIEWLTAHLWPCGHLCGGPVFQCPLPAELPPTVVWSTIGPRRPDRSLPVSASVPAPPQENFPPKKVW